jgi:hypothetical protein
MKRKEVLKHDVDSGPCECGAWHVKGEPRDTGK